jgi:hypothetical protein
MKEELNHMKYLKIENNKVFYLNNNSESNEIDKISKEDLMNLLNKAVESDFEMDEYKEENIANKAHQIIYKNIYEKFKNILDNKTRFKDESQRLYKDALDKYSK